MEPTTVTLTEEQLKKPSILTFHTAGPWVMKIEQNKIYFNQEEFPDMTENEFAQTVLDILKHAQIIQYGLINHPLVVNAPESDGAV